MADESVEKVAAPVTEKGEYEEFCEKVNAISSPLASRKLAKKVYKLIKKASKKRENLRQGLADVYKAVRHNETGIVILAGNVTPIDIYSHIPALCESKDIPYVFTPSREHLGLAAGHKRPSILLLIKKSDEYGELFDEVRKTIEELPPPQ